MVLMAQSEVAIYLYKEITIIYTSFVKVFFFK